MLLFVDNLINVDFSYLDAERGLVGETWLASVELGGQLDAQGMVCDFGIVKKIIREWLDEFIDHRLLVPENTRLLEKNSNHHQYTLHWQSKRGAIKLGSPSSALTFIPADAIDFTTVAQWCIGQLMPLFPKSVQTLNLHFKTESISGPYYHYSHGLKKHKGNCQRIAHGHRSKLEVWIDDEVAPNEVKAWADKWKDVYVGSEDDLICKPTQSCNFSYQAQQGSFELSLPKNCVYLIPSDSTVELIAQHIAENIKQRYPNKKVRVKAYEGLAKGAIVER